MNAKSASRTKIRCAEVGLGHLAQVAIIPAFAHAETSELAALVTGDPTKQKELSKRRNERLATFTCSFGAAAIGCYTLIGTKGLRAANPAYEYSRGVKLS
jgi:hypothetical protein